MDDGRSAPSVGSATPDADAWIAAWSHALSELELDVARVEQVLAAVHRGAEMPAAAELLAIRWEAPSNLGPLPHPLIGRAQSLLLRQRELVAEVTAAAARTRRHAHAAASMRDRPPAPAVYVDVAL